MEPPDKQLERYASQIRLQQIGLSGQQKILKSKVLIIGAGGLGSPMIQYLSAAGIGRLGIIDHDKVETSNLHRQIIHPANSVGDYKTESAKREVGNINPDVKIDIYTEKITATNAREIIRKYNVVADGSDNFLTRYIVNDACFLEKKTLVSAAVSGFDGQLSTYKPHTTGPCYRCFNPTYPETDDIWTCAQVGVLGPVAGVMGCLQATEVIKELLSVGQSMAGRILIYDGLNMSTRVIKVKPDKNCELCSRST
jgi:adenylyltransferase/sulfurtransferase